MGECVMLEQFYPVLQHITTSSATNKKSPRPGIETRVSCVTGRNTDHYTTSELILLGYRSIFKKYHTKTPRDKIGEISTTTCQWVTIHLLDTMCEMNGMCRETVVRK